jgi:maleylacetate reductase
LIQVKDRKQGPAPIFCGFWSARAVRAICGYTLDEVCGNETRMGIQPHSPGPPEQALSFVHDLRPVRVVFGQGALGRIGEEAGRLAMKRALLVSTGGRSAAIAEAIAALGDRFGGHFDRAAMHTPVAVTQTAQNFMAGLEVDGIVALGGGSATGLAKALALRTGLPQIAVPTTYAGSEVTSIVGETAEGKKVTRTDPLILPRTVIYDVNLTLSLPPDISGTSAINAAAHAVEALYAQDRDPVISLMARECLSRIAQNLPTVIDSPGDVPTRSALLYGAWLGGTCLGAVGMSLHHKLCHTLGGMFDLPHAALHTAILPHALAYNAPAIPEVVPVLDACLGGSAPQALYNLAQRVGARTALRDLGMPQDGIPSAVEQAMAMPYWNPRPLDPAGIRKLLEQAWTGLPPITT